ncbi:MAG: ImmA/IrrE family metallo-endopeptidase [Bacteroidales bacterium]|nr:ImmA/IrrE family metallo-endopeptidase [Bacteroidales bacterium]
MIFGNTIRIARDSRGLSQSSLAELIGVTQATLSRFEKGVLEVSPVAVERIAQALNYPVSFFSRDIRFAGESSLFYRKRASMTVKNLSMLESKISILSNSIDELMESIDIPDLNIPAVEPSSNNTPQEIAFKIRSYLGVPSGPIDNMVSLLEKNGVIVMFLNLEGLDKFDGLTMFTAKQAPIIWINRNISNDRNRFNLAHELGHLVMHLRSEDLEKTEDQKELEANQFAGEFLMPESQCREDFFNLKYRDLAMKKLYWKVSKAAIIYRAKELKCISEETAKYLFVTLGRNGERKNESVRVPIDSPKIVKKMYDLHVSELDYSILEMEDITGLKSGDINFELLNISDPVRVKGRRLAVGF